MTEEQNKTTPIQGLAPAQAVAETAKSVTKFTAEDAHEVRLPSPSAVNYMVSVANLLLDSTLITPDMGKTVEQIKSNAIAKMLVGLDFEMSPMESLQEIDIVRNRVFMRYPRLMAALDKKGLKPRWIERSNEKCSIGVTRPGREEEVYSYTIEDARMAGLVSSGSQYVLRPRVMLSARAISEAYRMTGGKSNVYTPEEKQEIVETDLHENGQPAEPENRYTVGRKPAPGSDAEFAAAGKAAAEAKRETKPPVAETKPATDETKAPPPPAVTVAAVAHETKPCSCVAPNCMFLEDGKLPAGRTCREGHDTAPPPPPVVAASAPEPEAKPGPQLVPEDPGAALRKRVLAGLEELTDNYKQQAPKTVMSKFNNFFRGVLGVTNLPKDPQVFLDMLPALKAAITADPDAFWKDPAGAGRIEAQDRATITEKLAEWKWSPAMMGVVLRAKYFLGLTGTDVCEYIVMHELPKAPAAAAEAFLKMAAVSRETYRIKPIAKWGQMSYDELLNQIEARLEKPIGEFTEKELVSMIETAERTMAEEVKKQAAAERTESPTVGQEPEQEGLPWDTEA